MKIPDFTPQNVMFRFWPFYTLVLNLLVTAGVGPLTELVVSGIQSITLCKENVLRLPDERSRNWENSFKMGNKKSNLAVVIDCN